MEQKTKDSPIKESKKKKVVIHRKDKWENVPKWIKYEYELWEQYYKKSKYKREDSCRSHITVMILMFNKMSIWELTYDEYYQLIALLIRRIADNTELKLDLYYFKGGNQPNHGKTKKQYFYDELGQVSTKPENDQAGQ